MADRNHNTMTEEDKYPHSESPPDLSASPEVERKHAVWAALDCIADGTFTMEEAMKMYGITEADIARYKPTWDALGNDE